MLPLSNVGKNPMKPATRGIEFFDSLFLSRNKGGFGRHANLKKVRRAIRVGYRC